MLTNNDAFKYETPYNGPSEITQWWNNGTVIFKYISEKNKYNIRHIKLYKYDTNFESTIAENDV